MTRGAAEVARILGLRRTGRTWRGACPVHGGTSFTLAEKAGKVLLLLGHKKNIL